MAWRKCELSKLHLRLGKSSTALHRKGSICEPVAPSRLTPTIPKSSASRYHLHEIEVKHRWKKVVRTFRNKRRSENQHFNWRPTCHTSMWSLKTSKNISWGLVLASFFLFFLHSLFKNMHFQTFAATLNSYS